MLARESKMCHDPYTMKGLKKVVPKIIMISREITSLQHSIVKHLVKIRQDRAYRREEKSALIIGSTLVEEIGRTTNFKRLIIEKNFPLPLQIRATEIFYVSESILKKICGVQNPEPIAAEVELPPFVELKPQKKTLV